MPSDAKKKRDQAKKAAAKGKGGAKPKADNVDILENGQEDKPETNGHANGNGDTNGVTNGDTNGVEQLDEVDELVRKEGN
jgi:hypothetical protein